MARNNENQDNAGEDGVQPQVPRPSRRRMMEDIGVLQQDVREAQEGRQRAEQESQALRAQLNQLNGRNRRANADDDDDEEANAPNHATLSKSQKKYWKTKARTAGCRAAALYDPFLDTEMLAGHQVQTHIDEILDDVKRSQEADNELEDLQNPALYWDTPKFRTPGPVELACEMIYHLPKSPGKSWLEDWFQAKINEGVRKQRSALAHHVLVNYAEIFSFQNPAFKDRAERPNLPEVQAHRNFLHINEKDGDGNPNLGVFFRDPVIVKVLRLLLLGQSAILTGKRSPKARKSYQREWHIKRITPSLLAYAATVIHFVLIGDQFFEIGTGTVQYSAWYHARLRLLEGLHERRPEVFLDLMKYYNKEVLGIDLQAADGDQDGGAPQVHDDGMDDEDLAFLEQIGA